MREGVKIDSRDTFLEIIKLRQEESNIDRLVIWKQKIEKLEYTESIIKRCASCAKSINKRRHKSFNTLERYFFIRNFDATENKYEKRIRDE